MSVAFWFKLAFLLTIFFYLTMFLFDRAELMKKANGTYFPEEVVMLF